MPPLTLRLPENALETRRNQIGLVNVWLRFGFVVL